MNLWQAIKSIFIVEQTPKQKFDPPCPFGYIDLKTGDTFAGYMENGKMKYRRKTIGAK